jgi:hypothetical protein
MTLSFWRLCVALVLVTLLNTTLVALVVSRGGEPVPDWVSHEVSPVRRVARLLANPFVLTMRQFGARVRGSCTPCASVPRDSSRSFTIVSGSTLPASSDGDRSYELDMLVHLAQYAALHGYRFVNASDEMIALHRARTTAVHWLKPRVIANALDRADDGAWVVWFDTDLLITNTAVTLEALVNDAPPATLLVWSRDNEGLNAGALFWRANNASRRLARDWLAEESRGAPTDQKGLRVAMLRRAGIAHFEDARFADHGYTPRNLTLAGFHEAPACRFNAVLSLHSPAVWLRGDFAIHMYAWSAVRKKWCLRQMARGRLPPIECIF